MSILDLLSGFLTGNAGRWEHQRQLAQQYAPENLSAAPGRMPGAASQWGPAWADDTGPGGILDRFRTPRFDATRAYNRLGIDPSAPVDPNVEVPLDNRGAQLGTGMGSQLALAQLLAADQPPPPLPRHGFTTGPTTAIDIYGRLR